MYYTWYILMSLIGCFYYMQASDAKLSNLVNMYGHTTQFVLNVVNVANVYALDHEGNGMLHHFAELYTLEVDRAQRLQDKDDGRRFCNVLANIKYLVETYPYLTTIGNIQGKKPIDLVKPDSWFAMYIKYATTPCSQTFHERIQKIKRAQRAQDEHRVQEEQNNPE